MNRIAAFLIGFLAQAGACVAAPAPITVPTIATLVAGNFSSYPTVQVLGYYTAGDGGGGMFNWSPASTATAEPCITFQTGGLSTGRFVRNLMGQPLSLLQCGVKADGTAGVVGTNNSTALQAAFTAMSTYSLGEIYCPASAGIIDFSSSITPVGGGVFRGQNNTLNPTLGSTSTAPGSCHLRFNTNTIWAFDYQTPFTAGACPSALGPSFYNFTLSMGATSTGNGIRVNDTATAGFSDDCAGTGGGQSQVFGVNISEVVLDSQQRGTTAIQLNKVFDANLISNHFSFFDTQIDIEGSDNVLVQNNKFKLATLRALDIQSHGTFGNYDNVLNNTFFSVYTNASDFVRSSARSGVGKNNYFETDFSGITTVLNLTCALSHTWSDNAMELIPANVSYWLTMTGDCTGIELNNNYNGGGGQVAALWNSGSGSHWFANSSKQKISAWNNPDNNLSLPYATIEPVPQFYNNAPAGAGSVLGTFDASYNQSIGGDYASAVYIGPSGHKGDFVFPPFTGGTGGHVTFRMDPAVNATVDTWIYAHASAGTSQIMTCAVGATSTTFILTGGTTPTWYNPAALNNLAVTDPLIDCYNADTTHNQTVYISKWQLTKH